MVSHRLKGAEDEPRYLAQGILRAAVLCCSLVPHIWDEGSLGVV